MTEHQHDSGIKEEIARKAVELYKSKGMNNVSIVEICKTMNIARTVFYYHFPTKESVFQVYLLSNTITRDDLVGILLSNISDWDKYLSIIGRHIAFLKQEGKAFTKELLKANFALDPPMLFNYDLTSEVCVPLLRNCQESGIIRDDVPAEDLNQYSNSILTGILAKWSSMDDVDLDEEYANACEVLFKINKPQN